MEAALVLENLNRLDNLYRFVSFFEMKFFEDEDGRQKIKLIKNLLKKTLIDLALNLDKKVSGNEIQLGEGLKITSKISEILVKMTDILLEKKFQDLQPLVVDLQTLKNFFQNYEDKAALFLIDGDKLEIQNLKEKILIIMSEIIG